MITATITSVAILGQIGRSRCGSKARRLPMAGGRSREPAGSGSISQPAPCAAPMLVPVQARPRCTTTRLARMTVG